MLSRRTVSQQQLSFLLQPVLLPTIPIVSLSHFGSRDVVGHVTSGLILFLLFFLLSGMLENKSGNIYETRKDGGKVTMEGL